ncbi:hypothetical protein P280DRAFT_531195 [Massarina eburnea CBS 473.64]|uniref:Uncharacterized protein n=1 Tax=Massarina eburnea CBS 473.64 TaxID=1395130 RepID=A0A6A6SFM3_9PLEO|nr:hypothetical protein P280DRAFT_531195 [Massarina eburnea CBS 473.64]
MDSNPEDRPATPSHRRREPEAPAPSITDPDEVLHRLDALTIQIEDAQHGRRGLVTEAFLTGVHSQLLAVFIELSRIASKPVTRSQRHTHEYKTLSIDVRWGLGQCKSMITKVDNMTALLATDKRKSGKKAGDKQADLKDKDRTSVSDVKEEETEQAPVEPKSLRVPPFVREAVVADNESITTVYYDTDEDEEDNDDFEIIANNGLGSSGNGKASAKPKKGTCAVM